MRFTMRMAGCVFGGVLLGACQDITADLPAGTVDPEFYHGADAAYRMTWGVRQVFQGMLMDAIKVSGGLSDELRAYAYGGPTGFFTGVETEIDSRILSERRIPRRGSYSEWGDAGRDFGGYSFLQRLRAQAQQARAALATYAPDSSQAVQGEMLVYEGAAVVLLADLFCSGVPLTTVDFEQDFTYRPGSPTADLYRHAIALFDSVTSIVGVDARISNAARVGKGRALLALGRYPEADAAVAAVPSGMRFEVPVAYGADGLHAKWFDLWSETYWDRVDFDDIGGLFDFRFVSDREGVNGLPFVSSGDPRVVLEKNELNNVWGMPDWHPVERTHLTVADHVEARLIQSEAAVNAGRPEWLDLLNALRTTSTTCTVETMPCSAPAGTGGVAGLPLLTDPALDPLPVGKDARAVRLDLVFAERAYWLFLTGHRQGDLRRLVREYGRSVENTYPTGAYPGGTGAYDRFIDLPIPERERLNPHFQGCLGRDG